MPASLPKMDYLCALVEAGEPVCISFLEDKNGTESNELYCELVSKARHGKEYHINSQRCSAGEYVLGRSKITPSDYYLRSERYASEKASKNAATTLPIISKEYESILIAPLSKTEKPFEVCIFYLKPESVMRIIQALAYIDGKRVLIDTIGAASICGDCTARPLREGIGLSFGCKGSRKHTGYSDSEVPLGLRYDLLGETNRALEKLPETRK